MLKVYQLLYHSVALRATIRFLSENVETFIAYSPEYHQTDPGVAEYESLYFYLFLFLFINLLIFSTLNWLKNIK